MATSINQLYETILGREPDDAGAAYWAQQFGPTIEPHEIATFQAAAQPELVTQAQVAALYDTELGRAPDDPGFEYWVETFGPGPISEEDRQAFRNAAAIERAEKTGKPTSAKTTTIGADQSTLAPNFADYVYSMLAKAEQAANLPYQEYTGQRFAGPSPLQLRGFSGIANLADPAAYAEAQRFLTMAGTGGGNAFYTPTSFTTGLGTGITSLPETANTEINVSGIAGGRNLNALPTVESELSRFGVTPGWIGQVPSTAIPTSNTLEGAFPEAAASFADGGLATINTPSTDPYQLGSIASYMNPYTTNVTDIAAREARRQADIGRQAEQARLAQAGAYGGSRQAIMEAERQRNLNTQIGDIATSGLASAYDQALKQRLNESALGLEAQKLGEQSRQFGATFGLKGQELGLQAGQALTQLGTQQGQYGLDALNTMLTAGGTQQQLAQQPLDFAYQQWQESMKYPYQQATFMSSMLGGLPLAAAPYSDGSSSFATGLQGLLAGLALTGGLK